MCLFMSCVCVCVCSRWCRWHASIDIRLFATRRCTFWHRSINCQHSFSHSTNWFVLCVCVCSQALLFYIIFDGKVTLMESSEYCWLTIARLPHTHMRCSQSVCWSFMRVTLGWWCWCNCARAERSEKNARQTLTVSVTLLCYLSLLLF